VCMTMRNGSKPQPIIQKRIKDNRRKVKFNEELMYGQKDSQSKDKNKEEHNLLTKDINLDDISFEDIS